MVVGTGEVPTELEDKARLAVANCPEFAVSIRDVAAEQGATGAEAS